MKIGLIVIGKTDAGYFVEAINEYKNRLTHYIPFEMEVIPDIKNVKNLSEAQQKISLSKMTFSHQMIRLIFIEQIYRAMTILNNEPYHHE